MRWWSRWSPSWCWFSTLWTRSRGSGSAGRPRLKLTRTGPRWVIPILTTKFESSRSEWLSWILEKCPILKIFFTFSSSNMCQYIICLVCFRYRSGSGNPSTRSRPKKPRRIEKGNAVRKRSGSRKSKTLTSRGNLKRKRTGKSNLSKVKSTEKLDRHLLSLEQAGR